MRTLVRRLVTALPADSICLHRDVCPMSMCVCVHVCVRGGSEVSMHAQVQIWIYGAWGQVDKRPGLRKRGLG